MSDREHAAGPHGSVAGDSRGDVVELVAQAQGSAEFSDLRGEVAQ